MKERILTKDFILNLEFRFMDKYDLEGFYGCESPNPMIASTDDYVVVLDGERLEVYDYTATVVDYTDDIYSIISEALV
jgi:hypothetical protein